MVAADSPTLSGRRLGNYELIESVGAGGMAAVLKARDLELGRIVALKILPPAAARDPESVTRFKQEARAAALLDHENIARVYACGEDQGLYFIAFEFVEGINLRQMIERRGTISAADSVRYMIQVAAGLAHAAERGVVHRDIKPSNILITPDGRAKIVDMGLARQLEMSADGGLTQSGVTLGTFDYISPEQALDPRRADVRSDIYSLGCTFYHALTGRPPVPEGTAAKKLQAHQHTDPLDPRQIKPGIPDELVVILARMMAKDQTQRYQSPEELIAHLKGLAERLHISTDAVAHDSVVRSVRAAPSLQPPHLRLGWVLGTAAVAIAVAALALSTGDPGPTPPAAVAPSQRTRRPTLPPARQRRNREPGVRPDDVVRTAEQFAAKMPSRTPTGRCACDSPRHPRPHEVPEPIVFRGKELELVGSVSPPTILKVNPSPAARGRDAARRVLRDRRDSVSVSGVRFETANRPTPAPRGRGSSRPTWAGHAHRLRVPARRPRGRRASGPCGSRESARSAPTAACSRLGLRPVAAGRLRRDRLRLRLRAAPDRDPLGDTRAGRRPARRAASGSNARRSSSTRPPRWCRTRRAAIRRASA